MKKIAAFCFLLAFAACTTGSHEADGGYTKDSTAGNVNSVSNTRDSAGVGSMYKDSIPPVDSLRGSTGPRQ